MYILATRIVCPEKTSTRKPGGGMIGPYTAPHMGAVSFVAASAQEPCSVQLHAAWLTQRGFAERKNLRNGVLGLKISVSISPAVLD